MGMYTELVLNVALNDNITAQALAVLRGMVGGEDAETVTDREHALFRTERWKWMLHSSSHYFVPEATAKLVVKDYCASKHLSVRCDLKNYSGEIEAFLDWLAPCVEDGFAGYKRYEEDDDPTLIYFSGGKVELRRTEQESKP